MVYYTGNHPCTLVDNGVVFLFPLWVNPHFVGGCSFYIFIITFCDIFCKEITIAVKLGMVTGQAVKDGKFHASDCTKRNEMVQWGQKLSGGVLWSERFRFGYRILPS